MKLDHETPDSSESGSRARDLVGWNGPWRKGLPFGNLIPPNIDGLSFRLTPPLMFETL